MEIEEVQKRKKALEDNIETLLNDFTAETKLTITDIDFETLIRSGESSSILIRVEACL